MPDTLGILYESINKNKNKSSWTKYAYHTYLDYTYDGAIIRKVILSYTLKKNTAAYSI